MITSRSDRVPLLSRRHTPPEKQNGTSDRPTLPAPTTTPPPPPPLLRLPASSLSTQPHDFVHLHPQLFSPVFASLCFSTLSTRENALEKLVVAYRGFVRGFVVRVLTKKKKGKSGERIGREKKRGARDRARTLPRIHLFQSSRGARDSIREINDRERRRSGRSCSRGEPFLERPPGDQKARLLSRVRERKRERTRDTEILSRSGGWGEGRENCKENAGDIQRRPI